jgi:hypothetical protein
MGDLAKLTARHGAVPADTTARALSGYIALMFLLNVNSATAATDIQGTADNLRLDTRNATIVEILNALSSRFRFTYTVRSQSARPLTGIYSGTLHGTLTRVLEGSDYVLTLSERGLEILVLGTSNPSGAAAQMPASQATPAPTSSNPATAANPNPSLSTSSPPPLSDYVSQNGTAEATRLASP